MLSLLLHSSLLIAFSGRWTEFISPYTCRWSMLELPMTSPGLINRHVKRKRTLNYLSFCVKEAK